MHQFLEKHKLPQCIQYEIHNLNCPVTFTEIEFLILKIPPKRNLQVQMASMGELYQTFQELPTIIYNLFQKTEEGTPPNSF